MMIVDVPCCAACSVHRKQRQEDMHECTCPHLRFMLLIAVKKVYSEQDSLAAFATVCNSLNAQVPLLRQVLQLADHFVA